MRDVFFYVIQDKYKFICSIRVPDEKLDYSSDIKNRKIKLKLLIKGRFPYALI